MRITKFSEGGSFFKGNLHTHTTVSDGKASPEEIKRLYKDKGYDFLAITDHNAYGVYPDLTEPDFALLPGVELDYAADNKYMHVVGIGIPGKNTFSHGQNMTEAKKGCKGIQDLVNLLTDNGNHAIIAHPSWSNLALSDIADTKNLLGMEIYNHLCEVEYGNGNANVYYEHLCREGIGGIACVAVDDNHHATPVSVGGFVMVKAETLTPSAIADALGKGSFYASSGPLIYDFYAEDGVAHISCSPAERIVFAAAPLFHTRCKSDCCARGLTSFSARVEGAKAVRAIVTDGNGRSAYTQPLWL